MFVTSSIACACIGVGTFIAGTYVSAEAGAFGWYSGTFVILGIFEAIFGGVACKMRHSLAGLMIYLIFILACFVLQIGFAIGLIADQSAWSGYVGGE